jgi:sterol desaturase/sphingolipid hydroxylase (fatty acid hydroxylase superfamily)
MSIEAARFSIFVAVLVATLTWQHLAPARQPVGSVVRRWWVNGSMIVLANLVARLAAPISAVAAATFAQTHQIGLSYLMSLPIWAACLMTLIGLDLAIYGQHRAMHRAPFLWRLHAVHHADPHVDATTALRFHPGEIVLSMVWKALVVVLLGAPVLAVVVFEAAVNALAMFNHANGRLPRWIERALKPWLITPALHRLHHDAAAGAAAPNYGFSVRFWDRLFGSFANRPEPVHLGLVDPPGDPERLVAMLLSPLSARRDATLRRGDPPARPGGDAVG